jgi:hypothetical protein
MNRYLAHLYIYLALVVAPALAGCEQKSHITSGNFNGLSIGMSKTDALTSLARQGVDSVQPEVNDLIVVDHSSIHDLNNLLSADGLCIRGDKNALNISFDKKGNSSLAYSSEGSELSQLLIGAHTRKEVFDQLRYMLQNRSNIIVANCVIGSRYIRTKNPLPPDLAYLDRFDSWLYYLPRHYSSATIHFKSGKLESIDYIERTHETP